MVIESPHHFRSTFLVSHESLGKKTEVKMFFNSQPWRIVKNIEKWVDTQSCVNSGDIRNSERCLQFSCPMKLCMSLVIRAAAGDHRSLFLERWLMVLPKPEFTAGGHFWILSKPDICAGANTIHHPHFCWCHFFGGHETSPINSNLEPFNFPIFTTWLITNHWSPKLYINNYNWKFNTSITSIIHL